MKNNSSSTLLNRLSFSQLAGLQFNDKRDLYNVFGYKRNLVYGHFLAKFHRQDVAKRIISAPVSATWRNPPEIRTANVQFNSQLDKIIARQSLWKKIERADKLSGIGNYSILLLGFSSPGRLDKPVKSTNKNELLFIRPYSQPNARIVELNKDMTSSRFGKPELYELRTTDTTNFNSDLLQTDSSTVKTIRVHHSRIVHVAENTLENDIFGTPRLEAVFNLLDDLLKVAGGTAETFWLTGNRGMHIDIDKDTELTQSDASALSAEIDDYMHQLRRVLKTKGASVKSLGSDVPNPKDTFNMIVSLISGATGIPRRILTGSEAGQLASEQDRANWADRINERRFNFAEPCILLPLINKLIQAGILPLINPEDIEFVWKSNFQLTPLENAQTMAQTARASINFAKHLSEPNPILSVEEARGILGFKGDFTGSPNAKPDKNPVK